jgi:hypothetical protein
MMTRRSSKLSSLAIAAVGLTVSFAAGARSGGIAADSCDGCHNGGSRPKPTIEVEPLTPKPGDPVTVTLVIPAVNGDVGGFYLRTNGKGTLSVIDGATRLVDGSSVMHSTSKRAEGGNVRFSVRLTTPTTPTGITITAAALSANGDRSTRGDGAGEASKSFVVGCTPKTFYRDFDGDGYGGAETVVDCTKPAGFADRGGDCNDSDERAYPGARELCNQRDDNCDGRIDEDLVEATHYEDRDGDGYGRASGMTVFAKCPPPGYAPRAGDCDDGDPKINPGAAEVCNQRDDNCDGRVDERVRPICGVGMCARAAPTCAESSCVPGEPTAERCNGLDDDCDGETDEGDLCPSGEVCFEARCVPEAEAKAPSGDAGRGGPNGSSGSGGSNDSDAAGEGGCAVGGGSGPFGAVATIAAVLGLIGASRRRRS